MRPPSLWQKWKVWIIFHSNLTQESSCPETYLAFLLSGQYPCLVHNYWHGNLSTWRWRHNQPSKHGTVINLHNRKYKTKPFPRPWQYQEHTDPLGRLRVSFHANKNTINHNHKFLRRQKLLCLLRPPDGKTLMHTPLSEVGVETRTLLGRVSLDCRGCWCEREIVAVSNHLRGSNKFYTPINHLTAGLHFC